MKKTFYILFFIFAGLHLGACKKNKPLSSVVGNNNNNGGGDVDSVMAYIKDLSFEKKYYLKTGAGSRPIGNVPANLQLKLKYVKSGSGISDTAVSYKIAANENFLNVFVDSVQATTDGNISIPINLRKFAEGKLKFYISISLSNGQVFETSAQVYLASEFDFIADLLDPNIQAIFPKNDFDHSQEDWNILSNCEVKFKNIPLPAGTYPLLDYQLFNLRPDGKNYTYSRFGLPITIDDSGNGVAYLNNMLNYQGKLRYSFAIFYDNDYIWINSDEVRIYP